MRVIAQLIGWIGVAALAGAQPADPAKACAGPEFHEMDFVIGDWAVLDAQGRLMGHSRIELRVHGCALVEHWRGIRGGQGTGLMYRDPGRGHWVRVFVGPGFIENGFVGTLSDGGLVFRGQVTEEGAAVLMQVRYEPAEEGAVRIVDQESKDGGQTWTTLPAKRMIRAKPPVDFALAGEPAGVCRQTEYRQFDFWSGNWIVHSAGVVAGENRIEAASRGCLLMENWTGAKGVPGLSFNFYDPSTRRWNQRWVSPGVTLALSGQWESGGMRLRQELQGRLDEIAWTPLTEGRVRQRWRTSRDGGKTWQVSFDGEYRPASR